MSKNREIEAKTLLTKEVYQKLCHAFPLKADFKQENYYFDSPNFFLKQHQIGLRIRLFEDHAEQTMKVPDPCPVQKKFHEVIEINDDLSLTHAKELLSQAENGHQFTFAGNVGQYLQEHFPEEISQLKLFTWSKTRRILASGPQNCELTLDATSYPDGYQDYELEIENTDPTLIKKVQLELEEAYSFTQNSKNTNQNKIGRATAHRK
ncbi:MULTISPECIES: CYTH domain-containing protein [Lactobacillus]|uniref:CYTH domain-containing protein n=1 Tax=Lactobacillus xujianguonis TaxID=2495899 RepID=A0A437SSN7_9LACO|nr:MULTISPECIES: CYTH domain-containing protein [Lactobacillus]RVU69905.1 CYTH domain-containing protein [Lactobacillus xujianguonis]RVU72278.1 CYTH domain-containing protein [Lactobacillus xujianguonis]